MHLKGIFRYIWVLSNNTNKCRYHIGIAGKSSYDSICRYCMYKQVFMVCVHIQVYAGIACMSRYYLYEQVCLYFKVLPVLVGIEGICRYIIISMSRDCMYEQVLQVCHYITICRYCMYQQVSACICRYLWISTMTIPTHTDIYLHCEATHSDIPAYSLQILHVTMCRYYFEIPTDMAPTFWHTYTYLPTGSLMRLYYYLLIII